jgi:hypothetical protein
MQCKIDDFTVIVGSETSTERCEIIGLFLSKRQRGQSFILPLTKYSNAKWCDIPEKLPLGRETIT